MQSTFSRRAALTGAAAVAVAVPTVAMPASVAPDAELIQLGKLFDELVEAYADAERRSKPNHDAWERELKKFGERHSGPIPVEYPKRGIFRSIRKSGSRLSNSGTQM